MPLTKMQQEYLQSCTHRYNVKCGATGSGKSYVDIAVTIPQRIMAAKGEGLLVMIGNTRSTLERNILEPMRSLYTEDVVGSIRADNTAIIFGRKVYCLGADKSNSVSKIQGATFEWVYGDEVTTWAEPVFQMLKSRLRCPHSHFDGTCNPDSPSHWFKRFLDSEGIDIYRQDYTIWDGALLPEVVAQLEADYAGTVYYDRYIRGLWTKAEGLVYQAYQDAAEPRFGLLGEDGEQTFDRAAVSCDYGTQNAFAALLWVRAGGVWHVVKEYRYSGRDTGHQKTDADYVADMAAFLGDLPRDTPFIIDPSATSFHAAMRRAGLKVRKARNDVADGIREVASCMASGAVRYADDLPELAKEFAGYVWDAKADGDRPVKENDHLMDALRYGVATLRMYRQRAAYASPFEHRTEGDGCRNRP